MDEPEPRSDDEIVQAWRQERLLAAGYPPSIAELLAARTDIDLHLALRLVEQGCPHTIAALILL